MNETTLNFIFGGGAFALFGLIGHVLITFGTWKRQMHDVDNLGKSIDELRKAIFKIEVLLGGNSLLETKSPLNVSDRGYEYIKQLNLQNMIESHKDILKRELFDKLTFENLYDVQVECISYAEDKLENILSSDDINKIKDHAFKTGTPYDNYKTLIGIIIRNMVFAERGINLKEIDNHDPSKK